MARVAGVLIALAVLVAACGGVLDPDAVEPAAPVPGPDASGGPLAFAGLLVGPTASPPVPDAAVRVERFDLGDVTLADGVSAPLRGVLALPDIGEGSGARAIDRPFPLVVLLHGNHPICRDDPAAYGSWPCRSGTEFHNEMGLTWLLEAIAAQGAIAVAPAVNVQYTLGAGEPAPAVRSAEIVVRTLAALEAGLLPVAAEQVDLERIVLGGHSTGGQDVNILARGLAGSTLGDGRTVVGLVLVQPALNALDALVLADVPTTVILSECDGDVRLSGGVYVTDRLLRSGPSPVALVLLAGGSHNATNSELGPDLFAIESPVCEAERVTDPSAWARVAQVHREQLATIVPGAVAAALGVDVGGWAARVFDEPVTPEGVHLALVPGGARVPAFPGPDAAALGRVSTDGVTLTWCRPAYTTPFMAPGTEPCHRPELTEMVGQPSTVAFVWDRSGARATFPVMGTAGEVLRIRAFADVADVRLGEGPVVLRLVADDGSSIEVTLPVPEVLRFSVPPFDLAAASLPWVTARIELAADLRAVSIEVVGPAQGAIQIVSLGVD